MLKAPQNTHPFYLQGIQFLDRFYRGSEDNQRGLEKAIEEELPLIEFPRIMVGTDPKTGGAIVLRIGRNYVYVQVEGDEDRSATLPVDLLIDEMTLEEKISQDTLQDDGQDGNIRNQRYFKISLRLGFLLP